MRRSGKVFFAILLLIGFFVTAAVAAKQSHKDPKKVGILLVAFGSTVPQAQVAFENIDRKVAAGCPGIPVRWAYTSSMIRKKLAGQGKHLDSPEVALARMLDEGFTHVAVQSLHTIPGAEFHELVRTANAFKFPGGFAKVQIGSPLLAVQKDIERVMDAVFQNIPTERRGDEAVVFMGHGSHHPGNVYYAALMFQLQRKDSHVFVGCVEGYPEIDEITAMLLEKGIKRAYLLPFMSVAGDHARNDMAGDGEDSWKSVLAKAGIESVPILKGTAEYDNFVDIWVDHLKETLAQLGQ